MSDLDVRPSVPVAVKLASVAVHVDEMTSPGGHVFDVAVLDVVAIRGLLEDPDVRAYLDALRSLALLPVKRP